jgi:hypothetical protein
LIIWYLSSPISAGLKGCYHTVLFKLFVLDLFSPPFVLTVLLYSNLFVVMMQIFAPLVGSLGKSWCSYLLCAVLKPAYLLGVVVICNINPTPLPSVGCALEVMWWSTTQFIQKTCRDFFKYPFWQGFCTT